MSPKERDQIMAKGVKTTTKSLLYGQTKKVTLPKTPKK